MKKESKYDFYCEEVLSGKIEVKKVFESEKVLAYYHTKPSYETHIVIIPKEHIKDLIHLEEKHKELIQEIIYTARDIAKTLNIEKNGTRLITNLGKFQDAPHLHFHLVAGQQI